MFAQRFDPSAQAVAPVARKLVSRKRKIEVSEVSESESESESSSSESSDSSESDSDSSESESSSSDSSDSESSESDSDSETDTEKVSPPESKPEAETTSKPESETDPRDEDKMEEDTEIPADHLKKHSGILAKFAQSAKHQEEVSSDSDTEMADAHDLAPLPQPELPKDERLSSHKLHQKNLNWLADPVYFKPDVTKPFAELGLSSQLLQNIASLGFSNAFSVQVAVMGELLKDIDNNKLSPDFQGDILVNASTGSGKTLAYSIPIVEALQGRLVPRVRAIVLVPTRPLINQVTATFKDLAKGINLHVMGLTNDLSIKEEGRRIESLTPDIIVSTPGRLVDHLANGSLSMQALRFLVIDEADKLLNQSFQNWCEVVVASIEKWDDPKRNTGNSWRLQPQKLIFSATLTTDAGKLSLLKFSKPRLVIVNSTERLVNEMFSVPATLREFKLKFGYGQLALKPLLLAKFLLHSDKLSSVLVFAKSNDATLRLTRILNDLFATLYPQQEVVVAYINSTNNTSSVRARILRDFDARKIHVLVATDLIARGLDILSIKDVVNYDLPNSSREYVHRVGRTARANQRGEAFTMCFGKSEEKYFGNIMEDVSRAEEIVDLEGPPVTEREDEVYKEVMEKFQESLRGRK